MKKISYILICFLVFTVLFAVVVPAKAEDGTGFSLTPPIFELRANPGDKLSEVVSVYNNSSSDINIGVTIENLKPIGESGQIQVIDDDQSLPTLKEWVSFSPKDFTLKAGETRNYQYTIQIPVSAEPGGHFASLLFGTTGNLADGQGGGIISQKIGSLLLLTIAGDIKEDVKINNFSTKTKAHYKQEPVDFNLLIENKGNVYVRPRGYLIITNIFGQKVSQTLIEGKNILPSATRKIPLQFKTKKNLFGPYTATLSFVYGTTNKTLNATTGFSVWPWQPILIGLAILILFLLMRKRLWHALLVLIGKKH